MSELQSSHRASFQTVVIQSHHLVFFLLPYALVQHLFCILLLFHCKYLYHFFILFICTFFCHSAAARTKFSCWGSMKVYLISWEVSVLQRKISTINMTHGGKSSSFIESDQFYLIRLYDCDQCVRAQCVHSNKWGVVLWALIRSNW